MCECTCTLRNILTKSILFQIFIYFIPIYNVNGAPKLDTLLYLLTYKANSVNYEKLDYYYQDVVKLRDVNFKIPWKNIASNKRAIGVQRSGPTSTMTIYSLLNSLTGRNEYTTSIPIDQTTQTIKYPEPISKINSSDKIIRASGNTISEVLWGKENTISLPTEPNPIVSPPVTTPTAHGNGIIHKLIEHEHANNLKKLQDHGVIHPGYDYDDTICKIVNKRILCGYDKNLGTIPDEEAFTKLNGNCRMRGDRIECGYIDGTINLNNEVPYNQFSKNIYRTRTDEGQSVYTPQPRTNNQGKFDTLGKLTIKNDLHHYIRFSNLVRDVKVDFQRKYKDELSSRYKYYSLFHDYSLIQYQSKHRTPKSEKKSGQKKTTITMDVKNEKKTKLRANAAKLKLLRFLINDYANNNY